MEPPIRDGQNGVPRAQSESARGPKSGAGGSSNSGGTGGAGGSNNQGADVDDDGNAIENDPAALGPMWQRGGIAWGGWDEGGTNPANQSLLARLYQTQAIHLRANQVQHQHGVSAAQVAAAAAASAAALAAAAGDKTDGTGDAANADGAVTSPTSSSPTGGGLTHSASAGALTTPARHSRHESPMTSVDRIAALRPRPMSSSNPSQPGWDATSVRPLASSSSLSNFERRPIGAALHMGHKINMAGGMEQNVHLTKDAKLLAQLPESHAAHMHTGILPGPITPAIAKALQLEAAEKSAQAAAQASNAAGILGVSLADAQKTKKNTHGVAPPATTHTGGSLHNTTRT